MRDKRFTFLCSQDERQLLKVLSVHLQRSQGDTVRYLIHRFSAEFLQEGMDGLGCTKDKLKNHE